MRTSRYSSLIIAVALWKSLLLVFISTETRPLTMLVFIIEETFVSEELCRKSLKERDLKEDVVMVIPSHVAVVHANHACVPDDTGEPA